MENQNSSACSCCTPIANEQIVIVQQSVGYCPSCQQKGKKVDTATVKSMLSVSLREVQDTQYFFCKSESCQVVYFNESGNQTFDTTQVRERVYQKELSSPDVYACYCFQHTPESIRIELTQTGKSSVIDEINAGIQAGQCACDWRNPQGSCCLGNVITLVKTLETKLGGVNET